MGIFTSKPQPTTLPPFTYQNMIKYNTTSSIHSEYQILDLLGKGSFASVHKAKSKRSGLLRAVKIVDRIKHSKIQPLLLNQFDILKEMDHPNILKIYQIYQETGFYYIVSQLCFGRELYDILRECKHMTESETAPIFYQLCSAVQYLHSKRVMHRDLKPQNIMYDPTTKILKLIDFGSALRYDSQQIMQKRRVGTSYYIAPEVIDRCYNNKCDIWSMGVILYVLLSGDAPFKGKNDEEVLVNIKKGDYNFMRNPWDSISTQVKVLITDLLTQNPYQRTTIPKILKSDWLQTHLKKSPALQQPDKKGLKAVLSNMQKFKVTLSLSQQTKSNNIEGAVLVFMVNFVRNSSDQAELQRCFKELDLNGDGMLSLEELGIGLEKFLKVGKKEASVVAETIFKRVDTNNSGFIDYSQFIVAANNIQLAATDQNLELAFDCLDQDKNGSLSAQELRSRLSDNIPIEAFEEMLKLHVPNWKGEINKANFVAMMKKLINNH